jgi:hypothetical protein
MLTKPLMRFPGPKTFHLSVLCYQINAGIPVFRAIKRKIRPQKDQRGAISSSEALTHARSNLPLTYTQNLGLSPLLWGRHARPPACLYFYLSRSLSQIYRVKFNRALSHSHTALYLYKHMSDAFTRPRSEILFLSCWSAGEM